MIVET